MRRALERCSTDAFQTLLSGSGQLPHRLARHIGVSWPHRSYSADAERTCILEHPKSGRQIHLIGCVHGSEDSASEIRSTILDISPSSVVLPVCDYRYHCINSGTPVFPDELYNMLQTQVNSVPIPMPIKVEQLSDLVKSWLRGLGFEPGVVLQTAAQTAQHKSAAVVCGEPNVQELIQGTQEAMKAVPDIRATLMQRLQAQMFSSEGGGPMKEFLAAADAEGMALSSNGMDFALKLESVSTRRTARALSAVLRELLPEAMAVIVDRRDEEMTRSLLEAAGPGGAGPVVAVTGLMHLDGIERRCVESHLDSMYAQKYIG